jgi:hypothetical protein
MPFWLSFFAFVQLAAALGQAIASPPQVSEAHAREVARAAVEESLRPEGRAFFSVHRREDLEDSFCSFGWFRGGFSEPPCAFFFAVSREGYEFHAGKVDHHLCFDACADFYVAITVPSDEAIILRGASDSPDAFNRLARSYRIRVGTGDDAIIYVRMYLDLLPQNRRLELTGPGLELKQLAENRFNASYNSFDVAETQFSRWWGKYGGVMGRQSYAPVATQIPSGYLVTFLTLSDLDDRHRAEGPGLLRASIGVSNEGEITGQKIEPVHLP